MRKFKCTECGHEFEVAHGASGMGRNMKCPKCGGAVHRANGDGPPEGRGACGSRPGHGPGRTGSGGGRRP